MRSTGRRAEPAKYSNTIAAVHCSCRVRLVCQSTNGVRGVAAAVKGVV